MAIKQVGVGRLRQPGYGLVVRRMVQVTLDDHVVRGTARLEQVTDIPRQGRLARPGDTLNDDEPLLGHEHLPKLDVSSAARGY